MNTSSWRQYVNRIIGSEISAFSRYYSKLIQWKISKHDSGLIFRFIECPVKKRLLDDSDFPDLANQRKQHTLVLLNGTFNHHYDIQDLLQKLKPKLSRTSRIVVVTYNPYYKWLYWLANKLRIRKGELPHTFLTRTSLNNLSIISGYDVVKLRPVVYCPFRLKGIGSFINRILPAIPFIRDFALAHIIVLRPIKKESSTPSLSIIIQARNEKGNIENAIKRMQHLNKIDLEVVFVEGHSQDGTWEEILRVKKEYSSTFNIQAFQQTGHGKGNAVRLGFSAATKDLLTILDADLTMPPEKLNRFYNAYCNGIADFINGSRLIYPMEGKAMRFLNLLGNVFYSKVLSYVLDTKLSDSLCGTKLLSRSDYQRFVSWRKDFGDFDPFGDFELLFPAAILSLGIVDIPIRYLDRTYGSTNIKRFRHGLMLLKMVSIGAMRIKLSRIY